MRLSKLLANRAEAVIDFGDGDVLHATYYPTRVTGAMIADISALGDAASLSGAEATRVATSVTDILLSLVATWDLTDDTDAVVPLDAAHLAPIGLPVQWAILMGLIRAGNESAKSGAAGSGLPSPTLSVATSSPTA